MSSRLRPSKPVVALSGPIVGLLAGAPACVHAAPANPDSKTRAAAVVGAYLIGMHLRPTPWSKLTAALATAAGS